MKNNRMKDALENIARRGVPENTNLWPRIAADVNKRKSFMKTLSARPVLAIMLALLVILLMTGVAYAIGKVTGYIPGIGLIDLSAPLRVLSKPAMITRDGITLTVEQVVVDSNQTVVLYKVEGLTKANFDTSPANAQKCLDEAVLRLSSEELLPIQQTGGNGGSGYEKRVSYSAIPISISEFNFVMPCIQFTSPGKAPMGWELSLHLIPAPPDMTTFPVIEIANPNQPISAVTKQDDHPSLNPDTISLSLDRAVQMDDGYLLYATINWEQASVNDLQVLNPANIRLLDANGQEMQFSLINDENTGTFYDKRQTVIAIKTAPVQLSGPLTFILDSVFVEAPVDASFAFESGLAPKPGQIWEINQEINVGYGQSLHVVKATYLMNGHHRLSFDMESKTGVTGAMLTDVDHALAPGGGAYSEEIGPFSTGFSYEGNFPDGPITVNIYSITINISGQWKVQWVPPAISPVIPIHPEACLNMSKFKQALNEQPPLPEGLGGKVVLYGPYQGNSNVWKSTIGNLDGSNHQLLGDGDGNISPDSSKVAFSRLDEGIFITDLVTNQTVSLPGTGQGDFNPMWSLDGSQIVFNRGMGIF